jgi:hypothetical protein
VFLLLFYSVETDEKRSSRRYFGLESGARRRPPRRREFFFSPDAAATAVARPSIAAPGARLLLVILELPAFLLAQFLVPAVGGELLRGLPRLDLRLLWIGWGREEREGVS